MFLTARRKNIECREFTLRT